MILAGLQRLFADDFPLKNVGSDTKKEVVMDSARIKTPHSDSVSPEINSIPTLQKEEQIKNKGNQLRTQSKQLVSISIRGKTHQILSATSFPYHAGETPLNLLILATKSKHIQLDYQGSGPTAYVRGIANLYEMDHGPQSGWVYRVNGKAPKESSGTYRLHSGEMVEWVYTCNLGKDVGATFQ